MSKIILSYRRDDSDGITGRIFDRLVTRYGKGAVFRDIDDIPLGIDFREHINEALHQSDILIAVVGPKWMGPAKSGRARIDDEADPVRIEVEAALRRRIPVIPILVANARMPKTTQLPDTLKDFAFRNALTIDSGKDFDHHMGRLIRDMDRILDSKSTLAPQVATSTDEPTSPSIVAPVRTAQAGASVMKYPEVDPASAVRPDLLTEVDVRTEVDSGFVRGATVMHTKLGEGVIVKRHGSHWLVKFGERWPVLVSLHDLRLKV